MEAIKMKKEQIRVKNGRDEEQKKMNKIEPTDERTGK